MAATGRIRGRLASYDPDAELWRWADTGELASGWSGGPERPCPACGLTANPDDGVGGADPCIGIIQGCKTVCCGHGFEPGYIEPRDGIPVRIGVTVTPVGWPHDTAHTTSEADTAPADQPAGSRSVNRILWNRRPTSVGVGDIGDIDEIVLRDPSMVHVEQMHDRCWGRSAQLSPPISPRPPERPPDDRPNTYLLSLP